MSAPTPAATSDTAAKPKRHEVSDRLCTMWDAVIAGRAAKEVLDSLPRKRGGDGLALVRLPSWAWMYAAIDVGRKDRSRTGGRLLMHVRLEWTPSPVILLRPRERLEVSVHGVGLGNEVHGNLTLRAGAPELVLPDGGLDLPEEAGAPVKSRTEVVSELEKMVEAGRLAEWECLATLEVWFRQDVERAARSIAIEMAEFRGGPVISVIDDIGIEQVISDLVYGPLDSTGPSRAQRLLGRCLQPGAFTRVDASRLISVEMRRDARNGVSRAIGDTPIGHKIRKVYSSCENKTLAAVVEEYRRQYPYDMLSYPRALQALSPSVGIAGPTDMDPSLENRITGSVHDAASPLTALDDMIAQGATAADVRAFIARVMKTGRGKDTRDQDPASPPEPDSPDHPDDGDDRGEG